MDDASQSGPGESECPFAFEEVEVGPPDFRCGAMVMTPRFPMRFDAERRESVRHATGLSAVERKMLERIASRGNNTPILLFRAAGDEGERLWEFDPSFDDAELENSGRIFVGSLLPFYRRVVALGIVSFIHCDWRPRDLMPMRRGLELLADEIGKSQEDPHLRELDTWLIRNLLLHSSLSLEHVVRKIIPSHVRLMARRAERARELLAHVPKAVVD